MDQKPFNFFRKKIDQNKVALIISKNNLDQRVDPPDPQPEPCLGSTLELSFKIMIITTFIHILTWVM
jgi:hypothetical protein